MTYLSDVQFHGTTPEAAESISKDGFKVGQGSSAGRGVYLHDYEHRVKDYGSTVVAAEVSVGDYSVHPNPWADSEVRDKARSMGHTSHEALTDHLHEILPELGYHAHRDPDDHATVVYDPSRVHYLTHYDRKAIR